MDRADIITLLIRTHIVELQTRSLEDRMEVALHVAVYRLAYLNFVLPEFFKQLFQRGTIS